jgi:uncharacterized membrane protein
MSNRPSRTTLFLIVLLGGSGILHFVRPGPFVAIVPKSLPRKRELVWASGVCELGGAALMSVPATRALGGKLTALLFVVVLPANVSMALRSARKPFWYRAMTWLRLPLQIPLVRWAWRSAAR